MVGLTFEGLVYIGAECAPSIANAAIIEEFVAREGDRCARLSGVFFYSPFNNADLAIANSRPECTVAFLDTGQIEPSPDRSLLYGREPEPYCGHKQQNQANSDW